MHCAIAITTSQVEVAARAPACSFSYRLALPPTHAHTHAQEFSAALYAMTESLTPGAAPVLEAVALSSSGGSGGSAGRSSAGGRAGGGGKPLFPPGAGCGAGSPEAFYRVREALAGALKGLATAFKGSHPPLARALKGAVDDLEETGLFD